MGERTCVCSDLCQPRRELAFRHPLRWQMVYPAMLCLPSQSGSWCTLRQLLCCSAGQASSHCQGEKTPDILSLWCSLRTGACVRERSKYYSLPGCCRIGPEWPVRPTTAPAFISVGAFLSLLGCTGAGDVMVWRSAREMNSQGDPRVLAKLGS